MTDQDTGRPIPARDASPEGRNRRIPPLVWIILALLAVWLAVALIQRGGTNRTPHGESVPSAAEGSSIMPASPAHGSPPATPAGTVNGPEQPATDNAPR